MAQSVSEAPGGRSHLGMELLYAFAYQASAEAGTDCLSSECNQQCGYLALNLPWWGILQKNMGLLHLNGCGTGHKPRGPAGSWGRRQGAHQMSSSGGGRIALSPAGQPWEPVCVPETNHCLSCSVFSPCSMFSPCLSSQWLSGPLAPRLVMLGPSYL